MLYIYNILYITLRHYYILCNNNMNFTYTNRCIYYRPNRPKNILFILHDVRSCFYLGWRNRNAIHMRWGKLKYIMRKLPYTNYIHKKHQLCMKTIVIPLCSFYIFACFFLFFFETIVLTLRAKRVWVSRILKDGQIIIN